MRLKWWTALNVGPKLSIIQRFHATVLIKHSVSYMGVYPIAKFFSGAVSHLADISQKLPYVLVIQSCSPWGTWENKKIIQIFQYNSTPRLLSEYCQTGLGLSPNLGGCRSLPTLTRCAHGVIMRCVLSTDLQNKQDSASFWIHPFDNYVTRKYNYNVFDLGPL